MSSKCATSLVLPLIGVGLRHEHYNEALSTPASIDFVEVHAENFFAKGGATIEVITDIIQKYQVSLHATSLGLGSAIGVPTHQIEQLKKLVNKVQPILLSDHACFSWAEINDISIHGGDLLPIPFNDESLQIMVKNVKRVQNLLGRTILVENLSAYMALPGSTYTESQFLVKLCEMSNCKLLLDLNNLVVNATNHAVMFDTENTIDSYEYATTFLSNIPTEFVGEFHLAGCTQAGETELMIDDHSQPVADVTWKIYEYAIKRFGAIPTLIEWDEELPSWQVLIAEADKARVIATSALLENEQLSTRVS